MSIKKLHFCVMHDITSPLKMAGCQPKACFNKPLTPENTYKPLNVVTLQYIQTKLL